VVIVLTAAFAATLAEVFPAWRLLSNTTDRKQTQSQKQQNDYQGSFHDVSLRGKGEKREPYITGLDALEWLKESGEAGEIADSEISANPLTSPAMSNSSALPMSGRSAYITLANQCESIVEQSGDFAYQILRNNRLHQVIFAPTESP